MGQASGTHAKVLPERIGYGSMQDGEIRISAEGPGGGGEGGPQGHKDTPATH